MSTDPDGDAFHPKTATERVAEIARIFETARHQLERTIEDVGLQKLSSAEIVTEKLHNLHILHQSLSAAEETFLGKNGPQQTLSDAELEQIRIDLGRKIDRIRAAIGTDTVS